MCAGDGRSPGRPNESDLVRVRPPPGYAIKGTEAPGQIPTNPYRSSAVSCKRGDEKGESLVDSASGAGHLMLLSLEQMHEVQPFPPKEVAFGFAPKVAAGGGRQEDRPMEPETLDDRRGRQGPHAGASLFGWTVRPTAPAS
jgi:hypothetical protein